MTDGSRYWLIPDFQNASLSRLLTRPKVLAMPIALAAIVGGIVSLLLARYLASPIERLRRATRGYAAGDFSQRVGPTLGRRRDEIVDLAHALDEMAERLDLLLSAQRNLLRDVSHELRSPLARVQATLGLARQRGRGAEEELSRIEHEVERLNDLVGTILSFSRLESGTQRRDCEAMDLAELLATAIEDARLEGSGRNVALRVEGDAVAPFKGDPRLIHSAFENILRNAVRHSPPGGKITASLGWAGRHDGAPEYLIQFQDEGPGVPEAMLDKIFGPFVRVDGVRAGGGVGLGLAITRRAILAHGGSVRAENALARGLRVIVCLPTES